MNFRFFTLFSIAALMIIHSLGLTVALADIKAPEPSQAGDYHLLTPLPENQLGDQMVKINTDDPLSYVQALFKIFVAVAIALSVVILAYGGITYMTSDAVTLKSKGKEIIKRSLWGLLLLLTSYLIVSTINPNALNLERLFQVTSSTSGPGSSPVATPKP